VAVSGQLHAPAGLTPWETAPSTNWPGLDAMEEKSLPPAGNTTLILRCSSPYPTIATEACQFLRNELHSL
jgi:hypothetical protein